MHTLYLAPFLLLLASCATPPPVVSTRECAPPDMPVNASAQDLTGWALDWIAAYGCERSKRAALVEAWPR
jgi:hypothetical protein